MSTALPTGTLIERLRPVKLTIRAYYRQSLGEEKQQSIPTQQGDNERLAHALGITPKEWASAIVYSDVDRSGGDFAGREDLARLLVEAQPGDVIITWRQDRLGRDMLDASVAIRDLVKHRRCHLFTCETGLSSVTMDDANQTAVVMLRGFGGQTYLESLRKNVRSGLRERAAKGFAASGVPFGYKTVLVDPTVLERKQSKKHIVIDEDEAIFVRRIFVMYQHGYGYRKIAKVMNEEGAPSPRGRGWKAAQVWDMLRSPRYKGTWVYGRRRSKGRQGSRTLYEKADESEIITIDRPDLVIIPAEEWGRVQAMQEARKRAWPVAQAAASAAACKHMLSGILRCGACGKSMRIKRCDSRRTNWTRRYYLCSEHVLNGRCDNDAWVPAEEAEQKLIDYLSVGVLGQLEQSIQAAIRGEVEHAAEAAAARTSEAQRLEVALEELRRERVRLVKLAAASDEPITEVVDALGSNHERSKALSQALAVARRPTLDAAAMERVEQAAMAAIQTIRHQMTAGEAREALTVLFPNGLRFHAGGGLWLIEGAASVPTVRTSDLVRIPNRRH